MACLIDFASNVSVECRPFQLSGCFANCNTLGYLNEALLAVVCRFVALILLESRGSLREALMAAQ